MDRRGCRHLHMAVREFDVEHRGHRLRFGDAADRLSVGIAYEGEAARQHLTIAQGIEELSVAREAGRVYAAASPS